MRLAIAVLTLAGGLTACDFNPQRSISPDFGDSVRHNMAAQIVNPQAGAEAAYDLDGHRAGDAVERYRAGKVYHPSSLSTSDLKPQQAR